MQNFEKAIRDPANFALYIKGLGERNEENLREKVVF
jgi:hypothetical protein